MKRLFLALAITLTLAAQAQDNQRDEKFSPEKFDAELRNFITTEAHLSQQEATAFFPLYNEMQQKQRSIFDKQRNIGKEKPKDEEACKQAIIQRDAMDIELKRIQQTYHQRFLKVLPASKVYDILKAENRFHRKAMKNWGQKHAEQGQHAPKAHPAAQGHAPKGQPAPKGQHAPKK